MTFSFSPMAICDFPLLRKYKVVYDHSKFLLRKPLGVFPFSKFFEKIRKTVENSGGVPYNYRSGRHSAVAIYIRLDLTGSRGTICSSTT